MKVSWDDYSQYMEKNKWRKFDHILLVTRLRPACDLFRRDFSEEIPRPEVAASLWIKSTPWSSRCPKVWCPKASMQPLDRCHSWEQWKTGPFGCGMMWFMNLHFMCFFVGRTCSNLSGHCWGLRGEWSYFVTWPKWRTQVTWIAILRLLLLKVIEGYWPPSQLDGCNLQCNHLIDLIPNLSFLPFMCPEVEFLYSLAWLDNVTGDGYPRTRGNCNRKPNTRHGNHGSTGLWLVSLQHSRFGRPWVLQPLESSTRRHRNSWKALPKKRRLGRFDGCFWWPVRWLFGGAQVVDLMLAAVEKAVALPAGTGMGSPGVLLRLILRNFSREKDETAEIEATV